MLTVLSFGSRKKIGKSHCGLKEQQQQQEECGATHREGRAKQV
jgi:hypothetical protein